MLIDTHCHLSREYYDNLDEIISEMEGIMIISGCDDETNKEVVEIVNKYDKVYGTLGIHPEEIDKITEYSFKYIEDNLSNPKIVGIGEIGLDYYWTKDNIDKQKEVLIKQLDIATKYNKPIVIHSRDSIQDIYNILKNYKLKGTIHCFSSSIEMAKEFIKIGYMIGVGGTVTFNNSKKIQDVVKSLDLHNILIETDSPYLSPEPFRGKKNKPSNVYYVAKKISDIKKENIENVIKTTTLNAISQFDLKL